MLIRVHFTNGRYASCDGADLLSTVAAAFRALRGLSLLGHREVLRVSHVEVMQ